MAYAWGTPSTNMWTEEQAKANMRQQAEADPGGVLPSNYNKPWLAPADMPPLIPPQFPALPLPTPPVNPGDIPTPTGGDTMGGTLPDYLNQFMPSAGQLFPGLNTSMPAAPTGTYTGGGIDVGPLSMTSGDFTGNFWPGKTTDAPPVAQWGSELMNQQMEGFRPQVGQYAQEGVNAFRNAVRPGSRGFSASQNLMGKNISDAITRGYTDYAARVATPFATDITKTAAQFPLAAMGEQYATGRARGTAEQGTYNTRLGLGGDVLQQNLQGQLQNQKSFVDLLSSPGMAQILRGLMGKYLAEQPTANVPGAGGANYPVNLGLAYMGYNQPAPA